MLFFLIFLGLGFGSVSPVLAVGVVDQANYFSAEVVLQANGVLKSFEDQSGVKVSIVTVLEPTVDRANLGVDPYEIYIKIIRRPYREQVQIGSALLRQGLYVDEDVQRLRRLIRQDFVQGWYDPALLDLVRYVRNSFQTRSLQRKRGEMELSGLHIFGAGLVLLVIGWLAYLLVFADHLKRGAGRQAEVS